MTLSYRSIGAVAGAAGGDITLNEPSGAAQGDLIVAFIAYRSNAAFTLPAGWTLVAQENSGDAVSGSAGISSCVMACIVRGSSVPSYTFTRSGGDVARGYAVAVQPGAGGVPVLDAFAQRTLPSGSTALSVTGFTTARADTLVVFGTSGPRGDGTAAWSAQAATDPAALAERGDSSTTTGADVSVSVSTAAKASAGATGNFTATSASSGRSCGIAAAFYEAVSRPRQSLGPLSGALGPLGR